MRTSRIKLSFAVVFVLFILTAVVPAGAALPLMKDKAGLPTLAPLLEKVTPAVVNIAVKSKAPAEQNRPVQILI